MPVPATQFITLSPFCHSQSVCAGNVPKSQKTSSIDAVDSGGVIGGYLKMKDTF